ncbi:hypothetical protein NPX13_g2789 [Xylaria arbuscula]|uniref:Alpha-L-rhamnosidase C-terminal domain-containing protein n=1 Tax=Xylaria arbuscula TaxID=114810 RepID=A0A9W8TNF2_9PEZI|nr:hypothetical protein NPX13_g2789 [Xylaria arbuscula]
MRFQRGPIYLQWALFASAAADIPYQEYILAPTTRILSPVSIYQTAGDVQNAAALLNSNELGVQCNRSTTFSGNGSYVTLDFGKNIAGGVSFHVDAVSGSNDSIGFTFSESSMYISAQYCDAVQNGAFDLPQWFNDTTPGHYKTGHNFQRGAFRYLTVVHNSTASISISNVTVYWAASPEMANPAAYTGYFHSDNEKLNRVWYAGAYTNQICSADPTTGVSLGAPFAGWYYNYTIANGSSVLLDGGKRDRIVWPGDIVISGPSIFVSTNSLEPIQNAIDSLFLYQEEDGRLPYAGIPLGAIQAWDELPLQFIDSSGLANVSTLSTLSDWGRGGMSGHNIEANSILFYTLNNALKLAAVMNDTSDFSNWTLSAASITTAANNLLWDDSVSLYRDNDTITNGASATSYPQDGNSWAVISGIAKGERAVAISDALKARWIRPYGAPAVEANDGDTISPFATGFELQAHFMAGHPDYALDLMEFMWADYMLDNLNMTNSTFIEGFGRDGTPLYPVYNNDPRVSHAHGWSTAPTSTLTFYAGGLTMTSAAGETWKVSPALGGLKTVDASYETPLGSFVVSWKNNTSGLSGTFEVPNSTTGEVSIPLAIGSKRMVLEGPKSVQEIQLDGLSTATVHGLVGGKYTVTVV